MTITYDNFFEQEITLENNVVRIEPLQQKHFEPLLPVALNEEIWRYKSAQINTEADFKKYFDTALEEKLTRLIPLPFMTKQIMLMQAAHVLAILILKINALKLAGHGLIKSFRAPALIKTANTYCPVLDLMYFT